MNTPFEPASATRLLEREQNFPLQEQGITGNLEEVEKPVAAILAERETEELVGIAAPAFLP